MPNPTNAFSRMRSKGGLYPADQWRPGQHYKAFDWSQHDQEDIPAEVRMQMHKESKGIRGPQTVKAARADMKSTAYKTGARPTQFLDTLKKRRGE